MLDYDLLPKHPRIALHCIDRACGIRPTPNADHKPHEIAEPDDVYLIRIGKATDLERGYYVAAQRDRGLRAATFREACDEFQSRPRALVRVEVAT